MPTNNSINTGKPIEVIPGGTQNASFTTYSPVCGGTTATGAFQVASAGQANVGWVLTSTGNASLPTWQVNPSGGGPSGPASTCNFKAMTTNNVRLPNLTGDGTIATVIFPQAMWNVGGAYNTGTGVFTAPATGYFLFFHDFFVDTIAAGNNTGGNVIYQKNGAAGQNNTTCFFNYYTRSFPGGANPNTNSTWSTGLIQMNAGDTMKILLQVSGGAKNVGIAAGQLAAAPTSPNSFFAGYQVA